ncbi:hypothetical protein F5Y16DRAFT_200629 [Xylariaceae sp. FL0255]|nr:hypothetical protein F5Y16DRAFT_200629 [Xylariaceae sp. FL0255]
MMDTNPQKRKRTNTNSTTEITAVPTSKRPRLTQTLNLTSEGDAKILDAVESRYDIHLQSVISSSKIRQRVAAVLSHLAHRSPASFKIPSTTTASTGDTSQPKPRISILRAKLSDTPKLISIAEIAKREIEREDQNAPDGRGQQSRTAIGGQWFQYIALGEEIQQRPRNKEGDTIIEDTVLGRGGDEDDDDFEVMKTPFERAIEGRPIVRAVPVMSLLLARVSIEELKSRYGEQTNRPPALPDTNNT